MGHTRAGMSVCAAGEGRPPSRLPFPSRLHSLACPKAYPGPVGFGGQVLGATGPHPGFLPPQGHLHDRYGQLVNVYTKLLLTKIAFHLKVVSLGVVGLEGGTLGL